MSDTLQLDLKREFLDRELRKKGYKSQHGADQRHCLLIGITGSVATIKIGLLVKALEVHFTIVIMATSNAIKFLPPSFMIGDDAVITEQLGEDRLLEKDIQSPPPYTRRHPLIFTDADEWALWTKMGDPVLHIELSKWADILLIAPLSANTLAKLANGMSDNLVTCVCRAWHKEKPILIAPAMNTTMWTNEPTERHLQILQHLGMQIIPPICKTLACGDYGFGAMASVDTIVNQVNNTPLLNQEI